MIQIQDDQTQSVASAPAASNSTSSAGSAPVSAPAAPTTAPTADNNAEIDRLLAELDKLSKELETDKQAQSSANATMSPPVAAAPPAVATPTPQPAAQQASTDLGTALATAAPTPPAVSATEEAADKFDFDAFLADLEKKIDQEAAKNKSQSSENVAAESVVPVAAPTATVDTTSDFRQARSATPLTEPAAVDESTPAITPAASTSPTSAPTESAVEPDQEDLKSQNIFDMLGLAKISDEEKNQFLDELELMIWDDFIVHDLELLLTSEEHAKARQILDDNSKSDDERKEALVIFLEKLIPDLDEVLYEKALELKSEMMAERLNKLKADATPATAATVKQAESMIAQNRWRSAAQLLNSL